MWGTHPASAQPRLHVAPGSPGSPPTNPASCARRRSATLPSSWPCRTGAPPMSSAAQTTRPDGSLPHPPSGYGAQTGQRRKPPHGDRCRRIVSRFSMDSPSDHRSRPRGESEAHRRPHPKSASPIRIAARYRSPQAGWHLPRANPISISCVNLTVAIPTRCTLP